MSLRRWFTGPGLGCSLLVAGSIWAEAQVELRQVEKRQRREVSR
jgi:hypothetical protein